MQPSPSPEEPKRREEAVAPTEGRSFVLKERKIRNDYRIFFPQDNDPDSKSTADMQLAFFDKFRAESPIDAWEFLLARRCDEWDDSDKKRVIENLSDAEKHSWANCL